MDNFDPFSCSTFDVDRIETLKSLREFAYEMQSEAIKSLMILLIDSDREDFKKDGIEIKFMSRDERFRLFISTANNLKKTTQKLLDLVDTLPEIRQATEIRTAAALRRERKAALAKAGESGAASTHSKTRAIKAWAEQEAKTMRDSDMEIARKLAAKIPEHLAGAPKNYVRLIYEHLRKLNKQRTTAS